MWYFTFTLTCPQVSFTLWLSDRRVPLWWLGEKSLHKLIGKQLSQSMKYSARASFFQPRTKADSVFSFWGRSRSSQGCWQLQSSEMHPLEELLSPSGSLSLRPASKGEGMSVMGAKFPLPRKVKGNADHSWVQVPSRNSATGGRRSPNLRWSEKYGYSSYQTVPLQSTFDDICNLNIVKSFSRLAILGY